MGGGGTDRPDQPDDAGGGTERSGAGYRAQHRGQRAAVGGGVETDDQRDAEGRDPARHGGDQRRWARCFNSADYKEGRTAFMEKRPPRFVGR